jgi:hypothetical protein
MESGDRQVRAPGVLTETQVGVRYSLNLAALAQVSAYDSALDAEHGVIKAVAAAQRGTGIHLILTGARRVVDPDGWLLGEVAVKAFHQLALQ